MPNCSLPCIDSSTGNKAASVLPEPVGATTRMSAPSRIFAITAACIALSRAIPALAISSLAIDTLVSRDLVDDKIRQKEIPRYKLIPEHRECGSIGVDERAALFTWATFQVNPRYSCHPMRGYLANCDSMSVRVSGSRPSVFQIVIAYCLRSAPMRCRSNHDQRRSILFFLRTRSFLE